MAGLPRIAKWLLAISAAVLVIVVAALLALQQWLGSEDFRQRVAREASAAAGVKVTLARVGLDWWPLPALAVDALEVHTRPPLTLARLEVRPNWGALLRGRLALSTVVLRQGVVAQVGLDAVLKELQKKERPTPANKGESPGKFSNWVLAVDRVVLDEATWAGPAGQRVVLNADARLGLDGLPEKLSLSVTRSQFKGLADLRGSDVQVQREGADWALVVKLRSDAVAASGEAAGKEPGKATDRGKLQGKVSVQVPEAGGVWTLSGQTQTTGLDLSLIGGDAPARASRLSGRMDAQTRLSARATTAAGLVDALKTDSTFTVRQAVVHGIDLVKAVKTVGLSRGGETRLDVLAGQVHSEGKSIQLNNLVASSGLLSASGNVAVSPNRSLSGRMNVALGDSALPAGAKGAVGMPLVVGGTLDAPEVTLTRAAMIGAAIGTAVLPGVGTGAGASLGDKVGEKLKGLFGR